MTLCVCVCAFVLAVVLRQPLCCECQGWGLNYTAFMRSFQNQVLNTPESDLIFLDMTLLWGVVGSSSGCVHGVTASASKQPDDSRCTDNCVACGNNGRPRQLLHKDGVPSSVNSVLWFLCLGPGSVIQRAVTLCSPSPAWQTNSPKGSSARATSVLLVSVRAPIRLDL